MNFPSFPGVTQQIGINNMGNAMYGVPNPPPPPPPPPAGVPPMGNGLMDTLRQKFASMSPVAPQTNNGGGWRFQGGTPPATTGGTPSATGGTPPWMSNPQWDREAAMQKWQNSIPSVVGPNGIGSGKWLPAMGSWMGQRFTNPQLQSPAVGMLSHLFGGGAGAATPASAAPPSANSPVPAGPDAPRPMGPLGNLIQKIF